MLALFRISAMLLIGLVMFVFHVFAIALGSAVYLYFLPGVIAMNRHYRSADRVFIACAFTGWTVIGWLLALAFALTLPTVADDAMVDEYAVTGR